MRCVWPWAAATALALQLAACATQAGEASASAQRVDQVRALGSLRGTDLDGAWGVWREGQLQPERALRRRFDHLLSAIGELSERDLRLWIAREVTREHGTAAARDVLAVWDHYVALLQMKLPATPPGEGVASPRYELLGDAWARAFYSDDAVVAHPGAAAEAIELLTPEPTADAAASATLQARRVQQFGAAGAERLRAEDALRWDWAQRLARARAELPGVPATAAAQTSYLRAHFSRAELARARALLGLPP